MKFKFLVDCGLFGIYFFRTLNECVPFAYANGGIICGHTENGFYKRLNLDSEN